MFITKATFDKMREKADRCDHAEDVAQRCREERDRNEADRIRITENVSQRWADIHRIQLERDAWEQRFAIAEREIARLREAKTATIEAMRVLSGLRAAVRYIALIDEDHLQRAIKEEETSRDKTV